MIMGASHCTQVHGSFFVFKIRHISTPSSVARLYFQVSPAPDDKNLNQLSCRGPFRIACPWVLLSVLELGTQHEVFEHPYPRQVFNLRKTINTAITQCKSHLFFLRLMDMRLVDMATTSVNFLPFSHILGGRKVCKSVNVD